jgi:hypothetical protein
MKTQTPSRETQALLEASREIDVEVKQGES